MPDQNLVSYIRGAVQVGTPPETIRQALLTSGWQALQIDEGFSAFNESAGIPLQKVSPSNRFSEWRTYIPYLIGLGVCIACAALTWFALSFLPATPSVAPVDSETPSLPSATASQPVVSASVTPAVDTQNYSNTYCAAVSMQEDTKASKYDNTQLIDAVQGSWVDCASTYGYGKTFTETMNLPFAPLDPAAKKQVAQMYACTMQKVKSTVASSFLSAKNKVEYIDKKLYETCVADKTDEKNKAKIEACAVSAQKDFQAYMDLQSPCSEEVSGVQETLSCMNEEQLVGLGLQKGEASSLQTFFAGLEPSLALYNEACLRNIPSNTLF